VEADDKQLSFLLLIVLPVKIVLRPELFLIKILFDHGLKIFFNTFTGLIDERSNAGYPPAITETRSSKRSYAGYKTDVRIIYF